MARKAAEITDKDKEIAELRAKLDSADSEKKLAVMEALNQKDRELVEKSNEIAVLKGRLDIKETVAELNLKTL